MAFLLNSQAQGVSDKNE